jgi:hypothetical protein
MTTRITIVLPVILLAGCGILPPEVAGTIGAHLAGGTPSLCPPPDVIFQDIAVAPAETVRPHHKPVTCVGGRGN